MQIVLRPPHLADDRGAGSAAGTGIHKLKVRLSVDASRERCFLRLTPGVENPPAGRCAWRCVLY